ncbi:MAG: hypothetical protein H5T86_10055, partial [Armatimonadetes bacterium]|nr:hypothetical protein [Armatimonadota bacterium]
MGCFEILVILLALQGQVGAGVQETVPAPQNLVPNGRMEGEYVAGVAPGWAANCYGDYEARFEKETANVHSGSAAQKIVCTRFASGGIQIRCSGISVEQGKPYTLQAWLRGEGIRSSVLICIRQHAAPYTKYLAQYVRVSDRWRRFTVIGPSTATDPDCGVYIWYGSTGTLWIDDVVLLPGIHKPEAPAIDAPPVKGNRVYNSSFELGTCGWVGAETADGGWHGSHCLRITAGRTAESQPFTVTAGQAHTISMYARGAGAKLSAEISEYADEGGDQPIARHHETAVFSLTQDWQRYSFPAVLEAPFTCGYMLRLTAQGADALVDAVQVEEGPLSAYAPSRPLELGLELPVLKRYPLPRQPVEPLLRVWSAEARSPLKVTLTWRDFFGERRPAGEATVRPGPDGTANVRVRCRGCDYGIYSLSATAGHDCAPGEVVVGVLPADDGLRRPQSFFGTHAQMNPRSDNIGVLVARRAGMRWYRLHDFNHHVQWIACEPE